MELFWLGIREPFSLHIIWSGYSDSAHFAEGKNCCHTPCPGTRHSSRVYTRCHDNQRTDEHLKVKSTKDNWNQALEFWQNSLFISAPVYLFFPFCWQHISHSLHQRTDSPHSIPLQGHNPREGLWLAHPGSCANLWTNHLCSGTQIK